MEIDIYFKKIEFLNADFSANSIGEKILINNGSNEFPELKGIDIAIFGVIEDRNAVSNNGCADGIDEIRKKLYALKRNWNCSVADFGDVFPGEEVSDTYFAVSSVVSQCIKENVLPIIIGGSQDITFANYQAYEALEQVVNIVSVDNAVDLGEVDQPINSKAFLNKIILHQPNYLFSYSNLGYQTYFVSEEERSLMDKLFFDIHRLGEVKNDIREVEPIVRNADMLSIDISAVRSSDAPGNRNATPNGFNGEEICAITRYAGLSDKLSSIGIYEYNPAVDRQGQTAFLIAEMIWYIMEGYYNRKGDGVSKDGNDVLKYTVATSTDADEIVFYKNLKSDRWWMDVPYPESKLSKYRRHQLVPCSYSDYQQACNDGIPEKWWRNYKRLR
jgi:formiminoglutamase